MSGLAFEDPGTIIRTRGSIVVAPQSGLVTDLDITGAFGIGLVSQEAFAAGVASIPEPFTDSDWGGWMVIQPFAMRWEEVVGATEGLERMETTYEIDSKAMRKVQPNSIMVFVIESLTGAFAVADLTRLLIKLP